MMLPLLLFNQHVLLDNPPGNAAMRRKRFRWNIAGKPAGILQLVFSNSYLSAFVLRDKPCHKLARKRPALTPHIPDALHPYPGLLEDLSRRTLFKRFAHIEKTGYKTEAAGCPLTFPDQQELVVPPHQNDAAGMDHREMLEAAGVAEPSPAP